MSPQPDTQIESPLIRALGLLRRIEDGILVLLLMTMIGVAAAKSFCAIFSMLDCGAIHGSGDRLVGGAGGCHGGVSG